MASVTTRGRGTGIGRGRGFGVPKGLARPGETADQQKTSSNEKAADQFDLKKVLSDVKDETQVEKISQYISDTNSSTRIKEVVDRLTQRTIIDSDFAPLAAKVANKLCSDESFGNAFRADLLKSTQENYKKRDSIREESASEWNALVCLICELFNHLRAGETPLKPLAGAVYQIMSELLRQGEDGKIEREDENVDCFYMNFRTVGKLLESVNQVRRVA